MKQPFEVTVEDSDDLSEVFGSAYEPPYALNCIDNSASVEQDVAEWTGSQWIDILATHVRYGDEAALEHAAPLMAKDDRLQEKVDEWVQRMCFDYDEFPQDPAVAVKLAIRLGADINQEGREVDEYG